MKRYLLFILLLAGIFRFTDSQAQLTGDTRENPIIVGTFSHDFNYSDTKNTYSYTNQFQGRSTNDVFYRFTVTLATGVIISNNKSSMHTCLYLLDEFGNMLECKENYYQSYMNVLLAPGTYYVVGEGYSYDGSITTTIEASVGFDRPLGDSFFSPINLGRFSSNFVHEETQNTENFSNQYGHSSNDIFYVFTITSHMDVSISLCGSQINDTYLYLLNASTKLLKQNDNSDKCGSGSLQSFLSKPLAPGTYYVICDGKGGNGNIHLRIEGVLSPPLIGDDILYPINAGIFNDSFQFSDTRNTLDFTNQSDKRLTNEVYYKFITNQTLDISVSLCGSQLEDTYVTLLGVNGEERAYNDDRDFCAPGSKRSYLNMGRHPAGTYYIVSQGAQGNGSITTLIEGKGASPVGDNSLNPILVGSFDSDFKYSDTKDTRNYTNQYMGRYTNDVYYKFSTQKTMDVKIYLCESLLTNTFVSLLDASGNRLAFNDDSNECVSLEVGDLKYLKSFLSMPALPAGTYYVVSEGYTENGIITTRIEGTSESVPGDKMINAIDAGTFATGFQYTDTKNTATGKFTNQYVGQPTNDVFYKFTTSAKMDVSISLCNSELSDTYLYLLDSSGNELAKNDDDDKCGTGSRKSCLLMSDLAAGTYYVVCEGYSSNGGITTQITGSVPVPPTPTSPQGDKLSDPIIAGTFSSAFQYADTKNTTNFTNQYGGRPTNDVFYKFTTTIPMDVTISLCGSALDNTYLYLLNASGEQLDFNDDSNLCGFGSQRSSLSKLGLPAGDYFVVSKGYDANGDVMTKISGTLPTPPDTPDPENPESPESGDLNYIITKKARIETTDPTSLTADNSIQVIQYFDGLGRPIETVHVAANPDKHDLVSYQEYDSFGRESTAWIPTPMSAGNQGKFVDLNTLSTIAKGVGGHNDSRPYSQPKYEPSPLNRVTEQYGPGSAWSTHPVKTDYLINTSSGVLACTYYYLSGNNLVKGDNYSSGELYVTKITNEDNNISYEFKDKLGRVVLQRSINDEENHDTYYVYDDFGNLCYVLPPKVADETSLSSAIDKYAYVYRYDDRHRCIEKKLPGAEWVYMVYDKADRLILSQDGVERLKSMWRFYKYDNLGRMILTGERIMSDGREAWQNKYKNSLIVESLGGRLYGYTNKSDIPIDYSHVFLVNYYDNYDWNSPERYGTANLQSEVYDNLFTSAKGLLTGTMNKTLENAPSEIYSSFYYDYRGNLVAKNSQTLLGNSTNYEYYKYTFSNEVERKKILQLGYTVSVSEEYTYNYDHAGRMISKNYSLNGGNPFDMAVYEYNKFGQLAKKKTGGIDETNYSYNIRSWITDISGNRFSESLKYGDGGNISFMKWNTNRMGSQTYEFSYDNLNRMLSANYTGASGSNYSESLLYDKHGNPTSLTRYGRLDDYTSFGKIDELSITKSFYDGNRIMQVSDNIANQGSYDLMEFKYNYNGNQYEYDANGNLTKDLNKNISKIDYNYLNLPKRVDFLGGNYQIYTYDGSGVKSRIDTYQYGKYQRTDYVGNKVWKDFVLKLILTEEGYVEKFPYGYVHNYYLKDHLGNNRVVVRQDSTVAQITNYYPFGLSFAENPPRSDEVQPYKYNGKELDRELNLYDYGARMYDPALCRFMTMDPLAEKYYSTSPYAYCMNNPVNAVDRDGRLVIFINGMHRDGSGGKSDYWKGFDTKVMNHIKDWNADYIDGAFGGKTSLPQSLSASERMNVGFKRGAEYAKYFLYVYQNKDKSFKESIKVITHSMGAAYAKGFIQGLVASGVPIDLIEFEADFAPYQPTKQKAVDGVKTYQFSHSEDWVAGNEKMEGAQYMNTSQDKNQTHWIIDFETQVKNLPEGKYKVVEGKIVTY